MKTHYRLSLIIGTFCLSANAQAAAATEPVVTERGLHHRVCKTDSGSYVELATGMHFVRDDGTLAPSQELIEVVNGIGVARQGQQKVIFAPNLNTDSAIDLELNPQQRFRSKPMGLAYSSAKTGQSVWIAEIKDSIGEVQGNRIIYPDAFTDVRAEVRFTYKNIGFEADVLLLQKLPPPQDYGLDSETCQLQMWTEFFEMPAGTKYQRFIRQESDAAARAAKVEPDFTDEQIDFGSAFLGQGKAFLIENEAIVQAGIDIEKEVPVGKTVTTIRDPDTQLDRTFLIEAVEYQTIEPLLQTLPLAAAHRQPLGVPSRPGEDGPQKAVARAAPSAPLLRKPVNSRSQLVAALKPSARAPAKTAQRIQMAKRPVATKGLLLDYTILKTATNDYKFRSDTTYYISGQVTLGGTNYLEPGTVIKFAPTNSAQLYISGSGARLNCLGVQFRPSILTARDDDTVGEKITGSSGSPSGYYATYGIYINYYGDAPAATLNNLRISYANTGIYCNSENGFSLAHAQLVNCYNAAGSSSSGPVNWRNVLAYNCYSMFNCGSSAIQCENATFDHAYSLFSGSPSASLTNCLLVEMYTFGYPFSGSNNGTNSSAAAVFQTVGAGANYLGNNSPYRNAGTTVINAALLADLRKRTTYPPIVLTNAITTSRTLTPQAQRDTDTVDLGYHYDSLDYVVSGIAVTNANLNLINGVTIGVYGSTGLKMQTSSQLTSEGSPVNPNRLVRYHAVQEQANTNWTGGSNWTMFRDDLVSGTAPEARLRFTDFPVIAQGGSQFIGGSKMGLLCWRDCNFWGGAITWNTNGANGRLLSLTNNLFERVTNTFGTGSDPLTIHARNNLFKEGNLDLKPVSTNDWTWKDNLFDNVSLTQNANSITNSYNGYVSATRLSPNSTNDVVTNITYQVGTLGNYYQVTNSPLINTGSVSAATSGLYHFCTTTNQVKETNSIVDIGLHYIALNSNGQPIDTDGDGVPDYLEDNNGNGSVDSGETDWNNAGDWGLRVLITRPRNGAILP